MTSPNVPRWRNYLIPFLALLAVEIVFVGVMVASGKLGKGGTEVFALVILPVLVIVNTLFFSLLAGIYSWKRWRLRGPGLVNALILLAVAGPVVWVILKAVYMTYRLSRPPQEFLAPSKDTLPQGFTRKVDPQITHEGYQYWYASGDTQLYFSQSTKDSCQFGMSRTGPSSKQFQFDGKPGIVVTDTGPQTGFVSRNLYYDDAAGCLQIIVQRAEASKLDADALISMLSTMKRGGDPNLP